MKLKENYFSVVNDLANTSMELVISSHWSRDGFSEKDFDSWLKAVSAFLDFVKYHQPSEIIRK